jgi:heat shock protein HspQ
MKNRVAKFNIGDIVMHKRQGYRAVVVDVDPLFQASGRYNPQAKKREFALRNPWYRLLVDDSSQMTYVEECLLSFGISRESINNPKVEHYLEQKQGIYHPINRAH